MTLDFSDFLEACECMRTMEPKGVLHLERVGQESLFFIIGQTWLIRFPVNDNMKTPPLGSEGV